MAAIPDTTNAGFPYPTLDSGRREIRLLDLQNIDEDGTIRCSLQVADLDNEPKYAALSYTWGTQPAKHNIYVNDGVFKVRPSVHEFLTSSAASLLSGIGIFIDAICINQVDREECKSQIRLMRDVYSNADTVLAWLTSHPVSEDIFSVEEQVLANDFWSRVWIVQEVILAKNLIIQTGDLTFFPEDLTDPDDETTQARGFELTRQSAMCRAAMKDMGYDGFPRSIERYIDIEDENERREFQNMARAYRILGQRSQRQKGLAHSETVTLHKTVVDFGSHNSTRRRDKIFGLLGLTASSVEVDDKVPLIELYLQVLLEGLFELAADFRNQAGDESLKEFETKVSRFHIACMGTLGLGNDMPLCLVTYRAMQHGNVIPLSHGLCRGIRKLVANACFNDSTLHFPGHRGPHNNRLWRWSLQVFSWLASFMFCILLQTHRREGWTFGPNGQQKEKRTFHEWIELVDQIAHKVDQKANYKRPLPSNLVDFESEWRNKDIRGLPGAGYGNIVLWTVMITPWALWHGFWSLRRWWRTAFPRSPSL